MDDAIRHDRIYVALAYIDMALKEIAPLNLPAAVWDLQAARRRVEEAREKADG